MKRIFARRSAVLGLGLTVTLAASSGVVAAVTTNTYYVVTSNPSAAAPYNAWNNAATNIQAAVDQASADWLPGTNVCVVLVSNGVYTVSTNIFVTNAVTLRSVNGWTNTAINGGGTTRCLYMSHATAVVNGFTISNGVSDNAGGVRMQGGTLQNCRVMHNRNSSGLNGAGIYMGSDAWVRDCLILSNSVPGTSWQAGGGIYMSGNGVVERCVIQGNVAGNGGGGAIYMAYGKPCVVRNCLILGNECGVSAAHRYGGAVKMDNGVSGSSANVDNCTIVGNKGGGVNQGGIYDLYVRNSIVVSNVDTSGNVSNWRFADSGGYMSYSCTVPDFLPHNDSNITDDPRFVNAGSDYGTNHVAGDYHLQLGSPAVDSGMTIASVTNDIEGNPRPLNGGVGLAYDMGAYELSVASGPLSCSIVPGAAGGVAPFTNTFSALIAGGSTVTNINYYWWTFGPGTTPQEGATLRVVTNVFPAGLYPITLTVRNDAWTVVSNAIPVTCSAVGMTAYVKPAGSPQYPYDTWAKAATNIQDAVDAASIAFEAGRTNPPPLVLVSNGVYTLTTNVSPLTTTYIYITRGITVRSVNGSAVTVVDGAGITRCFWMAHARCVVDGFTIRNGYHASYGAGVYLTGGTLQNCFVAYNSVLANSNERGPAIRMGSGTVVQNCSIISNSAPGTGWESGGIAMFGNGLVDHCLIQGNVGGNSGGGVYMNAGDVLRNCLVVGNEGRDNTTTYRGGGAVMTDHASGTATIDSCTIVRNKGRGVNRGGLGSVVLRNSIVYFNVDTSNNVSNCRNLAAGATTYSCTTPAPSGGAGNTTNDPVFVKAGSGYGTNSIVVDYRLKSGSPCLNTGTNQTWMTNAVDLAGKVRIQKQLVDMGAYEGADGKGTVLSVR